MGVINDEKLVRALSWEERENLVSGQQFLGNK